MKIKMKAIKDIKTQGEARQTAINWQIWASEQDLSYVEIVSWQGYFQTLGGKFGLRKEFKENGII